MKKISYQDVIAAYNAVVTKAQAMDATWLKWQFWSYCGLKQLRTYDIDAHCALCSYKFSDGICPLSTSRVCGTNSYDCHHLFDKAYKAANAVLKGNKPLSHFHKAARKMRDRIKSLR